MTRRRANRASRRAAGRGRVERRGEVREVVLTLPGLPGGIPLPEFREMQQLEEDMLEAVGAMTPAMAYHGDQVRRGLPGLPVPKVRYVTEAAPDGLGEGVVLGEWTDRPKPKTELILPGHPGFRGPLLERGGA